MCHSPLASPGGHTMERTAAGVAVWEEAGAVLQAALSAQAAVLCASDLQMLEGQVQGIMRQVGSALLGGLARVRMADLAQTVPACATCGGSMRLVEQRRRVLQGLVGDLTCTRPY